MLTFAIVAVLAIGLGGLLAFFRGAHRSRLPRGGNGDVKLERGLEDIRINDVVEYEDRDWLVEGRIDFDEDGHAWRALRMMDGTDIRWLIVGMDKGASVDVRVLCSAPDILVDDFPPETVTWQGSLYKISGRGTASAEIDGQVGDIPVSTARCRFWRYQADGEKQLLIERWGDSYCALAGKRARPEDVMLLLGS